MVLRKKTQADLEQSGLGVYEAYQKAPYLSIKHSSYFHVYERLLKPYVGKPITFVEIGVLNGGSLFMWREFLGHDARIIGIELNPSAKRWEADGFEIWIGDQSDPEFWKSFVQAVGPIDVVLDDGGHSNIQQIQTLVSLAPNIVDGGLLLVEDTHTSYMTQFGNPSRHSFMNFAFDLVDSVNSRFPGVNASDNPLREVVSSVSFFESIVAFNINRSECFVSQPTSNDGISVDAADFRLAETSGKKIGNLRDSLAKRFAHLPTDSAVRRVGTAAFSIVLYFQNRIANRKSRRYFG